MNEIGTDCTSQSSNLDGEHSPGQRRLVKRVLLIVEIVAVAGLLLSAAWLWQRRDQLQRELEVAEQIEAALQASEQLSEGEQSSGATRIPCATTKSRGITKWQRALPVRSPGAGPRRHSLAWGSGGCAGQAGAMTIEYLSPTWLSDQSTTDEIEQVIIVPDVESN